MKSYIQKMISIIQAPLRYLSLAGKQLLSQTINRSISRANNVLPLCALVLLFATSASVTGADKSESRVSKIALQITVDNNSLLPTWDGTVKNLAYTTLPANILCQIQYTPELKTDAGTYQYTITPLSPLYEGSVSGDFTINQRPIVPANVTNLTATSIPVGATLSTSRLNGEVKSDLTGNRLIMGQWQWNEPTTVVSADEASYACTFTPNDKNYLPYTTNVNLTIDEDGSTARRYVSVSGGAGPRDGRSWASAYNADELQSAIDETGVTEVWVARGTYYPTKDVTMGNVIGKTFQMKEGVNIYGGFEGIETEKKITDRVKGDKPWLFTHETILSGDLNKDGTNTTKDARHVVFYGQGGTTLTAYTTPTKLEGFTITGGYAHDGGDPFDKGSGVLMIGNTTLSQCIVKKNVAKWCGGGIVTQDHATITESLITENTAENEAGGGIFVFSGNNVSITNSTLSNNTTSKKTEDVGNPKTGRGAGIFLLAGTGHNITNCDFINNNTGIDGGAIFSNAVTTVDNCNFTNNTATNNGGAIAVKTGTGHNITNSNFINNTASVGGGAIVLTGGVTVNVKNCKMLHNKGNRGAVFFSTAATPTLNVTNCLITNNETTSDRGSLIRANSHGSFNFINCTILNNKSSYNLVYQDAGEATYTFRNTIIYGNQAGANVMFSAPTTATNCLFQTGDTSIPTVTNPPVTVEGDPLFENPITYCGIYTNVTEAQLAALLNASYALRATSGCIGSGATGSPTPTDDIDGVTRPSAPSIGAYESQVPPTSVTIVPTDGRVYVSEKGNGSMDGSSWANALHGGRLSETNNTEITSVWVAAGKYTLTDRLDANGRIYYGGFPTAPSDTLDSTLDNRDFVKNETYITRIAAPLPTENRMMTFNSTYVVVDGFTFDANKAVSINGAFIYTGKSNGIIRNCIFKNGNATANGGALALQGAETLVENCTFINNTTTADGGAIIVGVATTITNCDFINNTANNGGAIALNGAATITVKNCKMLHNKATEGGVFFSSIAGATLNVTNCLITNNATTTGRGSLVRANVAVTFNFINCTILNNKSLFNLVWQNAGNGNYNFYNTILWGNQAATSSMFAAASSVSIARTASNCLFQTGDTSIPTVTNPPVTVEGDPLFENPITYCGIYTNVTEAQLAALLNASYALRATSGCIGSGATGSPTPTDDIDGVTRPSAPSIGAYEYKYTEVESIERVTPEDGETDGSEPFTFLVKLKKTNLSGAPIKVKLAYSDENNLTQDFPYCATPPPTEVEVPNGENHVTVTLQVTAAEHQTLFTVKGGGTLDKTSIASPDLSATVEISADPNIPPFTDGYRLIENNTHLTWFANQVKKGVNTLKGKINADFEVTDVSALPIGNLTDYQSFKGELIANTKADGGRYQVTITSNDYRQLIGGASSSAIVGDFDLLIKCNIETADPAINKGFFAWDFSGVWRNMNLTIDGKIKATGEASIAGIRNTGTGAKIKGVIIRLTENTHIEGYSGWGASLFIDNKRSDEDACLIEDCGAILENGATILTPDGLTSVIAADGYPVIKNTFIQIKGNASLNSNQNGLFCSKTALGAGSTNNFLIVDHANTTSRIFANGALTLPGHYNIEQGATKEILPEGAFALSSPAYGFVAGTVLGCGTNANFSNFTKKDGYAVLLNTTTNVDYGVVTFDLKIAPSHPHTIKIPYHIISSDLRVSNASCTINSLANWNAIADLVDTGNTMNGLTIRVSTDLVTDASFKQISKSLAFPFDGKLIFGTNAVTNKPYTLTVAHDLHHAFGGILGYLTDEGQIENANIIVNNGVTISGTSGFAGALIGYSVGSIKNSYVTVNGKISASGVSGTTISAAGGIVGYLVGSKARIDGSFVRLGPNAIIENATTSNLLYRTLGGFVGFVRGAGVVDNAILEPSPTTTFSGSGLADENGLFAGRLNDVGSNPNINNSYVIKENDATYGLTQLIGTTGDVTTYTLKDFKYGNISMVINTPYNLFPEKTTGWTITPNVFEFPGFTLNTDNFLLSPAAEATYTGKIAFTHTAYQNFELPYTIAVYSEAIAASGIRYVSEQGGAQFKEGYTFESAAPFSEINTLLADNSIKEIRLAQGEYVLGATLSMTRENLKLTGGWIDDTQRTGVTTVKRGSLTTSNHMVNITEANSVLEQIIFDGEEKKSEASRILTVSSKGHNLTLKGCTFKGALFNNVATTAGIGGSAVRIEGNNALIDNCIFDNNHAVVIKDGSYDRGGALAIFGTGTNIKNSIFVNNKTDGCGAAIVYWNANSITFENSLFVGNSTREGCRLFWGTNTNANLVMTNCTFANNTSNNAITNQTLTLKNCLIANDRTITGTVTATNCVTNASKDLFVNAPDLGTAGTPIANWETYNWKLAETALTCINKGSNADVTGHFDLAGDARIQKYFVDIGAYESNLWDVTSADITVTLTNNVTFVDDSKNGSALAASYALGDTIRVKSNITTADKTFGGWSLTGGVYNIGSETQDPMTVVISGNTNATITATEKDYVIRYAVPTVTGTGDGATFANAMKLTDALASTANEIRLAQGTFTDESFTVSKTQKLIGGWTADNTKANDPSKTIILRGTTTTNLLTVNGNDVVIENLTIDGAKKKMTTNLGSNRGINGVYNTGTNLIIKDVIFTKNYSSQQGPALESSKSLTVINSQFIYNQTDLRAAAAFIAKGSAFYNCLIAHNQSTSSTLYYGTIFFDVQDLSNKIVNCTFAFNKVKNDAALNNEGTVINSVFFGNSSKEDPTGFYINCASNNSGPSFKYTAIDADFAGNGSGTAGITENTSSNMKLAESSQLINTGLNEYVKYEKDVVNDTRIQKDIVDIGAYESAHKGKVSFIISQGTTFTGSEIDLRSYVTSTPLSIAPTVTAIKDATTTTNMVQDAGTYSVTMKPANSENWTTTTVTASSFTVYPKALPADSVRVTATPFTATSPVSLLVETNTSGTWETTTLYTAQYYAVIRGTDVAINAAPTTYGNYKVLITLTGGNYTGNANIAFTQVNPITVDENSFAWSSKVFDNTAQDGLVINGTKDGSAYTLIKGTDYTVTYTLNDDQSVTEAKDVGTYNAHVIIPAVVDSGFSNAFKITPVALTSSDYTISNLEQFSDDFKDIKITLNSSKESWPFVAGTAYTTRYELNGTALSTPAAAGAYDVFLTFIGNYSGNAKVTLNLHDKSIRYIANTANGNGLGYDWDNAIVTDSVDKITKTFADTEAVKTVYLKQGTYLCNATNTAALKLGKANASLIGGFPNTATQKDISIRHTGLYPTIITKANNSTSSSSLIYIENASNTLEGLTVDGNNMGVSPAASTENGAINTSTNTAGLTLKNMIIKNTKSTAIYMAGGLTITSDNCRLDSCYFIKNESTFSTSANGNGGAVSVKANNVVISRCKFSANKSTIADGGAVYVNAATTSVKIENSLFDNNYAKNNGSAIFKGSTNSTEDLNVINCTIVNNLIQASPPETTPGYPVNGPVTLKNSIVWGNMNGDVKSYPNITTLEYCNIDNTSVTGTTNFSNNPHFVTPSTGAGINSYMEDADWSLQDRSMCINRGSNTAAENFTLDLAGEPRFTHKYVDVGAYESRAKGVYTAILSENIVDTTYHANPYPATTITTTPDTENTNNITFVSGGSVFFQNQGGESYGPSQIPPTNAGTYTAQANITEPEFWSLLDQQTFVIKKCAQPFKATVSKLSGVYVTEDVTFTATPDSSIHSTQPFALTVGGASPVEITSPYTRSFPSIGTYSCVISKAGDVNFLDATPLTYSIEVTNADTPITVTNGVASHASYIPGRVITFTANTPETGKFFESWTVKPEVFTLTDKHQNITTNSFTGVNTTAITLEATYASIEPQIRYGTVLGAGMKNGYNWTHAIAFDQIQTALNETGVTTLNLAKGTYVINPGSTGINGGASASALTLPSGKKIVGGFEHAQNSATDTSTILTKSNQANTRILFMAAGTQTEKTTLENVTITGGSTVAAAQTASTAGGAGAGILTADSAWIRNCIITANNTSGGYTPQVNAKGGGGAGIFADGSHVLIENSIFSNNIASNISGAGLVLISGRVYNCQFIKNQANNNRIAGGMYILGTSTVDSCLFSGNTATASGGGIYNTADATITDCLFDGNIAVLFGGGIYDTGGVTITDCRFLNNKTTSTSTTLTDLGGGGLSMNHANSKVYSSYFKGNSSTLRGHQNSGGGAIGVFVAGGHVENCIIEENTGGFGPGVGFFATGTMDSCLIQGNQTLWNQSGNWANGALYFNSSNNVIKNTIITKNKGGNGTEGTGVGNFSKVTNNQLVNCTIIGNAKKNIDAGLGNFVLKNCIIYKNSTGIDLTKTTLINSAIMSDNIATQIPGSAVGTNSFYLDPTNKNNFGPRFTKTGSTDVAENDTDIDPRYIPGTGSVLINRGTTTP